MVEKKYNWIYTRVVLLNNLIRVIKENKNDKK